MTRWWLAAVLILPMAVGTVHPTVVAAQDAASLAGRWTLNRELSQFPREAGFNADWLAHSNSSGESTPTPGSQGGAPSGGNRTSFPVSRVSREDSMRNRCSPTSARSRGGPGDHRDGYGSRRSPPTREWRGRFTLPEGKKPCRSARRPPSTIHARSRAAGRPLQGEPRTGAPLHLLASRQPAATRRRGAVPRSRQGRDYQAGVRTGAAGRAARAGSAPAARRRRSGVRRPAGVRRSRATQDYDRQPEAQFKGLTTLGVVVEGLGTQATTCGLRQDAIESAVVKQLSGAGLKVSLNADEDTYLYVNVMTATLGNGMCISRYDATSTRIPPRGWSTTRRRCWWTSR